MKQYGARMRQTAFLLLFCFSRMRKEGFLFLSGGLGAGSCLTRFRPSVRERPRSRRVWLGVAIRRCDSACLEHVSLRAHMGGQRARGADRFAWQAWGIVGNVCGKRMVDVHFAWQVWDSGRRVGAWDDTGGWIHVAGLIPQCILTLLSVRFAWQVFQRCLACVSCGRRGAGCDLGRRWPSPRHVMSCYVMSCRVTSRHVTSRHVMSCQNMS